MKLLLCFLLAATLVGCAAAPLNKTQEDVAMIALKDNNVEVFKAQFSGEDSEEKGQYSCILDSAIKLTAQDKVCRTEIIKFLVTKGAKYTESSKRTEFRVTTMDQILGRSDNGIRTCYRDGNFAQLMDTGCNELILDAIDKMDPVTTGNFIANRYRNNRNAPNVDKTPEYVPLIAAKLDPICKAKSEQDESCRTSTELASVLKDQAQFNKDKKDRQDFQQLEDKRIQAEQIKQEADDKYLNSSVGQACEAIANIKTANEVIDREKKVGAESGYVNKHSLHEMGQMKVFAQETLQKMKAKVKAETGKNFNPSTCAKK
jgi:hypothetical protein